MKQKKSNKTKTVKLVNNWKYIKLIILLVLIIGGFIGICYGIWGIYVNIHYSSYKEKMEWYELDKLYDNEKATSTQNVYKREIAKLALGVVLNETDVYYAQEILQKNYQGNYTINEAWHKYASIYKITGINEEEFDKRASRVDAAIYLVQAIEAFIKEDIEITETLSEGLQKKVDEKNIENINKAISIGILENKSSDITDKKLIKGEFNKMLITVLEKYSTVFYKALYNQNTNGVGLVTDEEKLPENYETYPYIIDSIGKEIYEIKTDNMVSEISESPVEVYKIYKEQYINTDRNVSSYFDMILNVDYRTIDKEKFVNELGQYLVYSLSVKVGNEYIFKDMVEDYLDYVISNKIVLKGKATPLLPIIYSNGMLHFLRTKIELEIVNSNTNKNLLLWDENTTYNSNKIEVYVDVPVSPTYHSKAFRILNSYSLMNYVVKNDGNVEVK